MLSLPDWAFYPLASAAAAGMIATAVSFGGSDTRTAEEILAEGIEYEGEALAALTLGNGLEAEFLIDGDAPFARITAARGPLDGIQSAGAFFSLSQDELQALQGHRLRVRYEIRSSDSAGAQTTLINIFSPIRGQDAWERIEISSEFESYQLDILSMPCSWPEGYVSLWPAWASGANSIDLRSVSVIALEAIPCE